MHPFFNYLAELGYSENCLEQLNEEQFPILAEYLGLEYVNLENWVQPDNIENSEKMLELDTLYIGKDAADGKVVFAALDPLNTTICDSLRFALSCDVQQVIADPKIVKYFLEKKAVVLTEFSEQSESVIKYVDMLIEQAISDRASDIHFEPFATDFVIRYRVDGALYELAPPHVSLTSAIISRIKVMAELNIAERRVPQDGRIQKIVNGKSIDLRVSTLPTRHGESVVLRILDRSNVNLDIEKLNMPNDILAKIKEISNRPNGIFISTGPTGSGKTTTLYAMLNTLNTIDRKILTVEDPVEYELSGIVQVPVNEAAGVTFSNTLRSFLRQDPDSIMVGETRDLETAQIAVQASLTGHMVLSTLHTNDAAGAITRLLDMGIEPFLLSASLVAVLGQRLVRKICTNCRCSYEPHGEALESLNIDHNFGQMFYYGSGCEKCNNTGYKGRLGIYEFLVINDEIRDLINAKAPAIVIKQVATTRGMRSLRDDGIRLIFDGETTIDEVLKYT